MWVIKIGGSLHDSPALACWLAALTRRGRRRLVIVPGGGPWADAVRRRQEVDGFDDRHAHHQAIAAMERYGEFLLAGSAGLRGVLRPASTIAGLREVLAKGATAVWMAGAMTAAADDVETSWRVTSDSLAAWLAAQLAATDLGLIKAATPLPGRWPVTELVARGIVDDALPSFLPSPPCRIWWLGRDDHASWPDDTWQPGSEIVR